MIALMKRTYKKFVRNVAYDVVRMGQMTFRGRHVLSVTLIRRGKAADYVAEVPTEFVVMYANKEEERKHVKKP